MMKRLRSKRDDANSQERLFSKDYVLIMFSATCHAIMNQFYVTVMPLFVNKLGGLTIYAGLFATVYSIASLAVRPVSGILSDKFGRVKQLIIGAAICSVCCMLFRAFSVIPILLIFRALQGIGFGMHSTCAGAAAADVLPESRMAEGIGYFGMYSTFALALGPGIALAITAGDTMKDYGTLFALTAGMCLICVITNCFISYERKRKKTKNSEMPPEQAADSEQERNRDQMPDLKLDGSLPKTLFGFEYAIFAPAAVMILLYTGIACLNMYIAAYSRWRGFGNPSMYFLVVAASIFVSRLIFGRIVDRRGCDLVIIPGMAVMAISLSFIPLAGSLGVIVAIGVPIGLSFGAIGPTFNALLFKRCSPARRGTASGANFSVIDLGNAFGASLFGAIVDASDYRFIYWAGAILVALGLILYLSIASDRRYARRICQKAS